MNMLARSIVSRLVGRLRSRAVVELENLALRHQLHVLRRQRPGRLRLFAIVRLLRVWLYPLWARCLEVMVLVKPATVIQWHRQGFRLFWRWRSRSGRPSVGREVRDLIRQMSTANPLWGAPRIHGELLKLGIEISQATVAKYMVRRPGKPSPTWRSFLRDQLDGISAINMFVVATASFRLLYVIVILIHARRRIVRFDVTQHPTAAWLSRQVTEASRGIPLRAIWCVIATRRTARTSAGALRRWKLRKSSRRLLTLAERVRRAGNRIDSPLMSRSHRDLQPAPSEPSYLLVRRLLPTHSHASIARQGLPRLTPDPASQGQKSRRHPAGRWPASSLPAPRRLSD